MFISICSICNLEPPESFLRSLSGGFQHLGMSAVNCISESGFYDLIEKADARKKVKTNFRVWVLWFNWKSRRQKKS